VEGGVRGLITRHVAIICLYAVAKISVASFRRGIWNGNAANTKQECQVRSSQVLGRYLMTS